MFFTELTSMLESPGVYSCDTVLTGDFNFRVDDPTDIHAVRFGAVLQILWTGAVGGWADSQRWSYT